MAATNLTAFLGGSMSIEQAKEARSFWVILALLGPALGASAQTIPAAERVELLRTRETVWRAWFAGDTATVEQLVPPETIVISTGEPKWKGQGEVLQTATKFHADGGKLLRLDFPRTEVQCFGDVAIIYSQYSLDLEVGGKRSTSSGRVTEIFVRRNGRWLNSGWHTDSEP